MLFKSKNNLQDLYQVYNSHGSTLISVHEFMNHFV